MKKLTPKNKQFVKELIKTGGNLSRSSQNVGYHKSYGSTLMKQEKMVNALQVALSNQGLTEEHAAKVLKAGLRAYHRPGMKNGKKYPDFYTRQKYLDMFIKIIGGYAPEKHKIEHEQIILHISPETVRGLKDAKVITEEEADIIEAEIIEDKDDRLDNKDKKSS